MSYRDRDSKMRPGPAWISVPVPEDVTRETDPRFARVARDGRLWWNLAPDPEFRKRYCRTLECDKCGIECEIHVYDRSGKARRLDVRTEQVRQDSYKDKVREQSWMLEHYSVCSGGAAARERSYEREKIQHTDKAPFTGEEDPLFGGKDDEPF